MTRLEFPIAVSAAHPSLPGHFPGHPIVPGVLILSHVVEGLFRDLGVEVQRFKQVKFIGAMYPDDSAQVRCELREGRIDFWVEAARPSGPTLLVRGTAVPARSLP